MKRNRKSTIGNPHFRTRSTVIWDMAWKGPMKLSRVSKLTEPHRSLQLVLPLFEKNTSAFGKNVSFSERFDNLVCYDVGRCNIPAERSASQLCIFLPCTSCVTREERAMWIEPVRNNIEGGRLKKVVIINIIVQAQCSLIGRQWGTSSLGGPQMPDPRRPLLHCLVIQQLGFIW